MVPPTQLPGALSTDVQLALVPRGLPAPSPPVFLPASLPPTPASVRETLLDHPESTWGPLYMEHHAPLPWDQADSPRISHCARQPATRVHAQHQPRLSGHFLAPGFTLSMQWQLGQSEVLRVRAL